MSRSIREFWHQTENGVGLLACWITAAMFFAPPLILAINSFTRPQWQVNGWAVTAVVTIPLAMLLCFINGHLFSTTYDAFGEPGPLGINAAQRMPAWPTWFRPVVASWWLLLFLAGVWIALAIEYHSYGQPSPTWYTPSKTSAEKTPLYVMLLGGFAMTFAGNTFLLLSVGTFRRDPAFLMRIWRQRLLLDLLVMLAAGVAAYGGFFRRT